MFALTISKGNRSSKLQIANYVPCSIRQKMIKYNKILLYKKRE